MHARQVDMDEQPRNLPNAEYRRFEGMREYESLIDGFIPQTLRVIRVFDKSLSSDYNSPRRCDLLREFLRASRVNRLYIVLHEVDVIERHYPRFLELLQHFAHSISIRQTLQAAKHLYDPFVVFDASHYLHRFHYDHLRAAHGTNDVVGAQQLIDRFSEIWEASAPAVSTDVSGL
jgi:hypothetical protein